MTNGEARGLRARALGAGLRALGASGLPRLAAPFTRGAGAILMFHHVRPSGGEEFAPNRLLEITPQFLDTVGAVLCYYITVHKKSLTFHFSATLKRK